MVTKSVGWARWGGHRSDILRAARAAGDVLQTWSGFPPAYSVTIEFQNDLIERTGNLASLENLHRDEVRDIEDVTIEVEPSREAWQEVMEEHILRDEPRPPAPTGDVRIRVWRSSGVRAEVRGDERERVEGLALRLQGILGRGAPTVVRWDRWFIAFAAAGILINVGIFLGPIVPRWWGIASRNGKWETGEVVGLLVGPILGLLMALAIWYVFPNVEILDDGELSRFRRLRALLGSVAGAIVLGVAGSLVYDLVH